MISIKDNKYLPKENTDKISIIKNMTAVTHFPLECIYFHFVSYNKVSVGISCALGLAR